MKKILVTNRIAKEGLTELFNKYEVSFPDKDAFGYEEVISTIHNYDAVIVADYTIDKDIIDAASNLKIICNYGAGYNNVDVKYAASKGIPVTSNPDVVTEATSEIVLGHILSLMRRIAECDRKLRTDKNYKWGLMTNLGSLIYGKTIGIIGMGKIGRAVARRCESFGMNITYHNRHRLDDEVEKSLNAKYLPLNELLRNSDVISLNTPLKEDTHHLIGEKEFELMKPGVFLINVARGPVVDEKALIENLKSGKIAGAGLDVFENEPVISEELFNMDNVVLTPHIGTQTIDTRIQMAQEVSSKIIDLFEGRRPKNVVNPECFDKKQ